MRLFRAALESRGGNVAILFGLLATPVIALMGAGIDYSLAARDRSLMQGAIDAGALAGVRLLGVRSEREARAQAEAYVRANLPARLQGERLDIEIVNEGRAMRLTMSRDVPTSMLNIIGLGAIPVAATITANAPPPRRVIEPLRPVTASARWRPTARSMRCGPPLWKC